MTSKRRQYYNCTERPATLDVGEYYVHIVSFTRQHRLWKPCLARGWEEEDLLQFVAMGVHRRQSMPCRYNPKMLTVGGYLNMVTRNLLSHAFDRVDTEAAKVIRASVPLSRHDEESDEDSVLGVVPSPDEADVINDVVEEVERRQPGAAETVSLVLHGKAPAFFLTPKEAGALRTALLRRKAA